VFPLSTRADLIYLDSDDLLYPSAVAEAVQAWTPDTAKVQFQLLIIDGAGQPKEGSPFPAYPTKYGPKEIRREFLATGNYSWPPTTGNAYARGFLEKVLPLSSGHRFHDGTLNTIAPLFGEIQTIPKTLGYYRVHGSNDWAISSAEPSQFAAHINQKQDEMELLRRYAVRSGVVLLKGNLLDRVPHILDLRLCALKLRQDYPGRAEDSGERLALLSVKHLLHTGMQTDRRLIIFIWRVLVAISWGTMAKWLIALRYDLSARPDFINWTLNKALRRGQLAEPEKNSRRWRQPAAYAMILTGILVLRSVVDAPPFNVINALLQVGFVAAALMWGGRAAGAAAFLFSLGIDFFFIDPLFALGVHDSLGLVKFTLSCALALGFGITASRIFPWLLNPLKTSSWWRS
jgi:hypothetical protein